jgi:hypothetical protein
MLLRDVLFNRCYVSGEPERRSYVVEDRDEAVEEVILTN